uniref:Uncharacterized protein n=1 Tax=Meloidogyne enterolobii TaxID=390850 RepID=A0A6V7VQP3_MELEN|nr:unnamed protein product [Meloidogyne enterolobii]
MQQFQSLQQVVTTVDYNIPNECIWKNLWVFWIFIFYFLFMAILLFIFLITCCFVAVKDAEEIGVQDKKLNKQKTQKTISAATPPHIKQPKKLIPSPKPSPPPKKEKSKKKEEKEEKQQKLETAAYLTETFHPIPLEPKGQSQEEFIPASILVERETTEEMTPI